MDLTRALDDLPPSAIRRAAAGGFCFWTSCGCRKYRQVLILYYYQDADP